MLVQVSVTLLNELSRVWPSSGLLRLPRFGLLTAGLAFCEGWPCDATGDLLMRGLALFEGWPCAAMRGSIESLCCARVGHVVRQ
jgi:hypothetical protein